MQDYDIEDDEELIDYSRLIKKGKKQQPKRGNKSVKVNIDTARQALFECIEYKAPISKQACYGTIASTCPYYTTIDINKGTHLHSMGFTIQGKTTLHVEEAAFLVSRNSLVVKNEQGEILQFEDFVELLCDLDTDGWITFEKYQVFAHLKRLGYIVTRSIARESIRLDNATEKNTPSFFRYIADSICKRIYKDTPLVWNYKYASYQQIYSTLQIIPTSSAYKPFNHYKKTSFDWDIYKPSSNWKKKDPGQPSFQLIVYNIRDRLPSLYQQNQLFYQSNQFIMALVGDAEGISFLRVDDTGIWHTINK